MGSPFFIHSHSIGFSSRLVRNHKALDRRDIPVYSEHQGSQSTRKESRAGQCDDKNKNPPTSQIRHSRLVSKPVWKICSGYEYFGFDGAVPVVQRNESSWIDTFDGRPSGCVIVYNRTWPSYFAKDDDDVDDWREMAKTNTAWRQRQSSSCIVRVDPVFDSNGNTDITLWSAYCYNPCRTDADCVGSTLNNHGHAAYVCQESTCRRNPEYWNQYQINNITTTMAQRSNEQESEWDDVVLVTAADETFS